MPMIPMRLVLVLLMLFALAPAVVAQEATGPTGTIATENTAQQDAATATRIREILGALGGYEDVTVQVSEGIVTLRGTTASATEATELAALVSRVENVVAIKNQVTETSDLSRRLNPAAERFSARLEQLFVMLPLAAIALGVFLAFGFLGRLIAGWRWLWNKIAPNSFIAELYQQLVQLIFLILGLVIALDIVNATAVLGTILGAAGIIGLAIGFAVRDTVENYIASVMLSIRQPFRPNDTVEINGDQGKVIRLTSRATILLSFDGNHIRIPNATVFKSRIINFTQNAERRFTFSIFVDQNADLFSARALAAETVQNLPFVLAEPAAQAWIEELTPGRVEIAVAGWIDQTATSILLARGEALRQVKLAIEGSGVAIPDSTQRIVVQEIVPASRPVPRDTAATVETKEVEAVEAVGETSLERMIEAERDQPETEDLLQDSAAKE
jgi:small-conductance mechanosensitive channel